MLSEEREKKLSPFVLAIAIISPLALILITILASFGYLGSAPSFPNQSIPPPNKKLIYISLDGFRYSYLQDYPENVKNILRLQDQGISSSLQPVFPSKTFPNHWTAVTGLYPESHGIIANTMYDPVWNLTFKLSNEQVNEGKWYGGEPIWNTLQKNGYKTANYFWPGSEAEVGGMRPTFYQAPFDPSINVEERVNKVIEWLELDQNSPDLICLYLEPVDSMGHQYGPYNEHVQLAIAEVDREIGRLLDEIEIKELQDQVNIIVIGDHGMHSISENQTVIITDLVSLDDLEMVDWSPIGAIIPKLGRFESVYKSFQNSTHLKIFKKEEIPERFHYQNNRRITPLLAILDEGYSLTSESNIHNIKGGTHGYDNLLESMQTIFFAKGPSFKENLVLENLENIELYEMICAMFRVEPAPNNSTGLGLTLLK